MPVPISAKSQTSADTPQHPALPFARSIPPPHKSTVRPFESRPQSPLSPVQSPAAPAPPPPPPCGPRGSSTAQTLPPSSDRDSSTPHSSSPSVDVLRADVPHADIF